MNSCKMKFICIASACFKNSFSLLVATHYYICRETASINKKNIHEYTMHKKLLIFTCFLFGFLPIKAVDNNHLIDRLDCILKLQSMHIEGKEREIKILKVKLDNEHNGLRKLRLCN